MTYSDAQSASRRGFLKQSGLLASGAMATGALPIARSAHAEGEGPEILRVGLIGCGGRGSGAAVNALNADPHVHLVAVADLFEDRLGRALNGLRRSFGDRVTVDDDHQFSGFDSYLQLLQTDVDVVILATPPGFRPLHLQACAASGKHVFCEKPVAVDVPGIKLVQQSVAEMARQNLCLVSGLCWRYNRSVQETIRRVQEGAIGRVLAVEATTTGGELWSRECPPNVSAMERQLRNWNKWVWAGGDIYVESHIHSLDLASWVLGDAQPERAWGMSGGQRERDPDWGNTFDHHSVLFQFPDDVRVSSYSRNQGGASSHYDCRVVGTEGVAWCKSGRIRTATENWRYRGENINMYDYEHQKLFQAIRAGETINNGEYMTRSNLIAIAGRMASYTGDGLTWDQVNGSEQDLSPAQYDWVDHQPQPLAVPGLTNFS